MNPNLEQIKKMAAGNVGVLEAPVQEERYQEDQDRDAYDPDPDRTDSESLLSSQAYDEDDYDSDELEETPVEVVVKVERRPMAERPSVQVFAVGLLMLLGALTLGVILSNSVSDGPKKEKKTEVVVEEEEKPVDDTQAQLGEKDTQLASNQLSADVQRINQEAEARRKGEVGATRKGSATAKATRTPPTTQIAVPVRPSPPQPVASVPLRRSLPRSLPVRSVPFPVAPRPQVPPTRSGSTSRPSSPSFSNAYSSASSESVTPTLLAFGSLPTDSTVPSSQLTSSPSFENASFRNDRQPTQTTNFAFSPSASTLEADQAAFIEGQPQDLIRPVDGISATVTQGAIMPNQFIVTLNQALSESIPAGSRLSVNPLTTYPDGKMDAQVTAIERFNPSGLKEVGTVPPGAIIVEQSPGKVLKAKRPGRGFFQGFAGQILVGAVAGLADQVTSVDEQVLFGDNTTTISRQRVGLNPTTIGASLLKGGLSPVQSSFNSATASALENSRTPVFVMETNKKVSVSVKTPFQVGGL